VIGRHVVSARFQAGLMASIDARALRVTLRAV